MLSFVLDTVLTKVFCHYVLVEILSIHVLSLKIFFVIVL